ncbi:MAG: hypothetical protein ABIJ59_05680 [Pseudomonadota bacterium]
MKTIKYLLLLVTTILIAALVYFNQDYFLAIVSFKFNIKDAVYTLYGLPTLAYFGICFFLGLILAGIGTISAKFSLNKTIKEQKATIDELNTRIVDLKNELDVFIHDPFIKKGLANKISKESVIIPETETPTEAVIEAPIEIEAKGEVETETDIQTAVDSNSDTGADTKADVQEMGRPEEDSKPILL